MSYQFKANKCMSDYINTLLAGISSVFHYPCFKSIKVLQGKSKRGSFGLNIVNVCLLNNAIFFKFISTLLGELYPSPRASRPYWQHKKCSLTRRGAHDQSSMFSFILGCVLVYRRF